LDKEVIIHKISPIYTSDKLAVPAFNNKVDVFEERMKGWMLDWADHLNDYEHAGFAVLHIGLSSFQTIASFIKGEGSITTTVINLLQQLRIAITGKKTYRSQPKSHS
jgi:hypothetical protein